MTDWHALEAQLKALGVQVGKEKQLSSQRKKHFSIDSVIDGRFVKNVYGEVFCHEESYAKDHRHGSEGLFPKASLSHLCDWAKANARHYGDLRKLIFLDTETSGLAGGTGTYAFEVGVGRFTDDGFTLAQFFMRHPGEEPALLAGLTEFVDGMQAVVTYNGKAFDIPLLNTRFTLAGLTTPFNDIDHFDLLPLARRLWRNRLESRTLGNVETRILGVRRNEEEVPGYLIPEMYFEYLRSQDARPLAGIFYHNAIDILSLAGLFSHMACLLADPQSDQIAHGGDVVALARHFELMNDMEQAGTLYQRALDMELSPELYWDTVGRLSFLFKRQGDWQAAIELWELAANNQLLYAFEELAKYYEHHTREISNAIQWTTGAMVILERQTLPTYEAAYWQERFSHRLARLDRLHNRASGHADS